VGESGAVRAVGSAVKRGTMAACPWCRSQAGYVMSRFGERYLRCGSCDLVFRERLPDAETLHREYRDRYFEELAGDQLIGQRTALYRCILERIERHERGGSLLDVGCGCGFFIELAGRRGWRVEGIDPSSESVALAREVLGKAVSCVSWQAYSSDRRFDVITMINVIDHMASPWTDLQKALSFLKPGGLLYLRFPNGMVHAKLLRIVERLSLPAWMQGYFVVHLYSFSAPFVRALLRNLGFEEIAITNSAVTGRVGQRRLLHPVIGWAFQAGLSLLDRLAGGGILLGPSLDVMARKGAPVSRQAH
jgi:2-polyprenyl-3-methyl-5-hydroxy-6-metoxy-1,4-benzoquinol methylase